MTDIAGQVTMNLAVIAPIAGTVPADPISDTELDAGVDRAKKMIVVLLAHKLLIALRQFVRDTFTIRPSGLIPRRSRRSNSAGDTIPLFGSGRGHRSFTRAIEPFHKMP